MSAVNRCAQNRCAWRLIVTENRDVWGIAAQRKAGHGK